MLEVRVPSALEIAVNEAEQRRFKLHNFTAKDPFSGKYYGSNSLASLDSSVVSKLGLNGQNYVQYDRFKESFEANPSSWNKYWEGSYKNPRLAESQKEALMQKEGGRVTSLSIGDSKAKAVRTNGTGLTSTGSINPFGKLDAGLNI